ncbi:MAG TPA: hypothetical protein VF476_04265 [Chitinophagaceae bacterium]
MKKIFTFSIIAAVAAVVLASCVRGRAVDDTEGYWLAKERGDVVFRDANCGYFVVETNYGYTILRSVNGYRPYEGSVMYGDFGLYGTRNFYNYSSGMVITAEVVEVDLTYAEAQVAVEYYCPYSVGYKIKQNPISSEKQKRVVQ